MKFFAQLILIILFVPVFLVAILSLSIKFQLLQPQFWQNTFKSNNVYVTVSNDLKTYAESQTVKGGGKTADLKIITDAITPAIVEDFTIHNLNNFLGYANGSKKELLAYLPLSKLPKQLTPKSVGLSSEELPLTALLSKFDIDASFIPFSQIAYLGISINYLLIGSVALSVLFILLLFLLTENGHRFIAIGISLVISGLAILSSAKIIDSVQLSITNGVVDGFRIDEIILKTVAPSVLQELSKTWILVGVALLIVGVILFFVKKPTKKTT